MKVRINTHGNEMPIKNKVGDWYDLCTAEEVYMKAGEVKIISLGISVELPYRHTAYITARSSTPIKHGILMANGMGVIDNLFCGDDDVIGFVAYAIRDTHILKGTRIAQMMVMRAPEYIEFEEVESLGNDNRGGFGSTGE